MKAIDGSINCPQCGSSHKAKCFYTYENGHHCFSCGFSKSSDRSFTPTQKAKINIPELPDATTNPDEFSMQSLKWLAKFHVTPELIRKNRIMENSDGSIIYIGVSSDNIFTHYQQRWLGGDRRIITKGSKTPSYTDLGDDLFVIVEDFLSYIRVAEHFSCVCLWGTSIKYDFLKELFKNKRNCLVWLDNDATKQTNSGQEAAKKICKMADDVLSYKYKARGFSKIDNKVINILSNLDPKYYTNYEINQIIKGNLYGHENKQSTNKANP